MAGRYLQFAAERRINILSIDRRKTSLSSVSHFVPGEYLHWAGANTDMWPSTTLGYFHWEEQTPNRAILETNLRMMEILGWTEHQVRTPLFTPIELCPICCRWNLIKIPSRLAGEYPESLHTNLLQSNIYPGLAWLPIYFPSLAVAGRWEVVQPR